MCSPISLSVVLMHLMNYYPPPPCQVLTALPPKKHKKVMRKIRKLYPGLTEHVMRSTADDVDTDGGDEDNEEGEEDSYEDSFIDDNEYDDDHDDDDELNNEHSDGVSD